MSLKKIFLAALTIVVVFLLFAQQDEIKFVVEGRVTSDDGKIEGATITLYKDQAQQEVTSPARNGRFEYEFEYNHEYRLVFKRDGFFQKIIIISTYVPTEVLQRNNKFPPYPFELNFFEETDIIDRSFTVKPVARVFYNSQIDNFDAEIYLSDSQLREQIQAAEAERNALASERRSIGRANEQEMAALERDYDKAIADADGLYHKKEYEGAIGRFRDALMIFSDRSYPKDRIAEIQDLIAALKLAEETEQNYLAAIKVGDQQFTATQYNEAISSYQKALEYKPKDKYATDRIDESRRLQKDKLANMQYDELIARADQAFNAQVYPEAKGLYQQAIDMRPRDSQYPRDQIKKIDQELARLAEMKAIEEQYAAAMARGNSSFSAASYPPALNAFKEALSLKPGDEPAQERIRATEAAMQQLADNEKYASLIALADDQFSKEQLPTARSTYQQALDVKPNEQHPKDRIAEIDRRIQFSQQLEQLLTEANNSFTRKEYVNAKTKYQQVLALQADHELSKSRIAEIDQILAKQALDDQYAAAIASADQAFNAKQYGAAKGDYQNALTLKPTEKYPKDQIAKIDIELRKLADQAAAEEQYRAYMQQGNSAFDAQNYTNAITAYQNALGIKPNDPTATNRLAESQKLLAQQQTRSQYDQLIAQADQAFNSSQLPQAKGLYQNALRLLPDESYPKEQIRKIDEQLALDAQFNQLMTQADASFDRNQYTAAKPLYQQALTIVPTSEKAQNRIAEIDRILAQQDLDKQYNDLLAMADQAFATQQLAPARNNYQQASNLKPDEAYPKEQIQKIDAILADRAAAEEQYQAYMQQGNSAFDAENYTNAITAYQGALGVKANDPAATNRLAESRKLLAQQQTRNQFNDLIAQADQAFNTSQLPQAKGLYQNALQLLPDESYPKEQIRKIDDQLALDAQFNQLMTQADAAFDRKQYTAAKPIYQQALTIVPSSEKAQNRISEIDRILAQQDLDKQYNDLLAIADQAFSAQQLEPARNNYLQASNLKPEETYPKEQIQKIDAELARLAQLDADYNQAIQQGDQMVSTKEYDGAIAQYQQALKIKPREQYPADQIEKVKQLQAELFKAEQLERSYRAYINKADSLFTLQAYQPSRDNYSNASRLKPEQVYPKDKMAEIDAILADLQHQQEVLAGVTRAYQAAITRGDNAFKIRDFDEASDAYNEAHLLKVEEEYPVKQLAEIEKLKAAAVEQAYQKAIAKADDLFNKNEYALAKPEYQTALEIKANDTYATNQIATIDQKLKDAALAEAERQKLEAAYAAKIAAADQAFTAQNYAGAKSLYQDALTLKANEQYPADQIAKIDDILAELARLAELDTQYNQAMTSAKTAFAQDLLEQALGFYKQANELKPQEQEPPQRISEIEQLLAQRAEEARLAAEAEAKRLAAEKAARDKYEAAIKSGDAAMAQKAYEKAQNAYNEASAALPNEQYPKDKLAEIDQLLQQLAQAEAERLQKAREDSIAAANLIAFNKKIKEAEAYVDAQELENAVSSYQDAIVILPEKTAVVQPKIDELKTLIAQLAKIEADYQTAIQQGDAQFGNEAWSDAKSSYQKALSFKPDESYPKKQIEIIDLKIKELELLAEKAKAAEKSNAAYNEAIKIADENFEKQDYTVARFYYQKALGFQPENPYPQQRLDEITKLIDQSLTADQIKAYNDAIAKADLEFNRKGYTLARFYYNRALEIKSWEQYPKDRIKEIGKLTNTLLSQREEQDYVNWINTADEAFVNKDFAVARSYYQRAQALKKDEPYPGIKLAEIQKELEKMQSAETEKEYQNAITEADKAFESKNYSIARFYYNRALNLRPNEQYPKDQLTKIREVMGGN